MTMLVSDVMSVRLLCAREDTPIKELADRLVRNRIGGMPVVDAEGHVLGIVSESDLQPVEEQAARRCEVAADVMSKPVITLMEGDTVPQAARLLRRHKIKRAPVVREGRVVGMITQSDLLRPLLRTDLEIRADIEEALLENGLSTGAQVDVAVHNGLATLEGTVRDTLQGAVLARIARGIDGVIDVRSLLTPAA